MVVGDRRVGDGADGRQQFVQVSPYCRERLYTAVIDNSSFSFRGSWMIPYYQAGEQLTKADESPIIIAIIVTSNAIIKQSSLSRPPPRHRHPVDFYFKSTTSDWKYTSLCRHNTIIIIIIIIIM